MDKYCKMLVSKKVELEFQVVLNHSCVSRCISEKKKDLGMKFGMVVENQGSRAPGFL